MSWTDGPEFNFYWAVMACMVPRVKDTHSSEVQSGICVGTTS